MSYDELASNDETKEFKDEGEEDKISSVNLHATLKNSLVDHFKFGPLFPMRMSSWIPPPFSVPYNPFQATCQPRFQYGYFNGYRPSLSHQFQQLSSNNHSATYGLHSPIYHQPLSLMPSDSMKLNQLQFDCHPTPISPSDPSTSHPHVKRPLNAFMIFMLDNRAKVAALNEKKDSSIINQILGKMWHELNSEEQNKYFEKAKVERDVHRELYPWWTVKDFYAVNNKNKENSRPEIVKKCRARFGLDNLSSWCKSCKMKKRCSKFTSNEQVD